MFTCLCNEHLLTPHFYTVKLGFTRVHIFFHFCFKKRLWILIRTASVKGSNLYPKSMFGAKIKHFLNPKSIIFTVIKICSIFYRHVIVMWYVRYSFVKFPTQKLEVLLSYYQGSEQKTVRSSVGILTFMRINFMVR